MANHKSAIKRIRQTETRRLRNRQERGKFRAAVREFDKIAAAGDGQAAKKAVLDAVKAVQQAGSKGLLPANTVSRKVGRLMRAYNRVTAK